MFVFSVCVRVQSKADRERAAKSRPSEEAMEILDDLVVLGADADIPRPEGQPASNYVPADLFPSVLMVGGLCYVVLMRLMKRRLHWIGHEHALIHT